ncbi:hypothetical protein [Rosenbergiella collisarenosi]|uniref:hypothetical protein n=1 Tax=Rosenbergiella collisarenosi TaxID=1544695 RepID=UPI001F4F299D|nr:hypothetical protein [Rosenbergiella collisarenosi]
MGAYFFHYYVGISVRVASTARETSLTGIELLVAQNHWVFMGGTVLAGLAIVVILTAIKN